MVNSYPTPGPIEGILWIVTRCRGILGLESLLSSKPKEEKRLGGEERRLMHLVPAPAVRLMKSRVLSRPGVNSLVHNSPGVRWITRLLSPLVMEYDRGVISCDEGNLFNSSL